LREEGHLSAWPTKKRGVSGRRKRRKERLEPKEKTEPRSRAVIQKEDKTQERELD